MWLQVSAFGFRLSAFGFQIRHGLLSSGASCYFVFIEVAFFGTLLTFVTVTATRTRTRNRTFVIRINGTRLLSYDTTARRLDDISEDVAGANPIQAEVLAGNITLVVALFEDCSFALFELNVSGGRQVSLDADAGGQPVPNGSPDVGYQCPICLRAPRDHEPVATKCGHIFCRACIEANLTRNRPNAHMQWGSDRRSVATPLYVSLQCQLQCASHLGYFPDLHVFK
ncbi:uncharacterized protein LOC117580661 [Drosophila guanche]|uniref:uncharacterized protein LOC117580661 n=1 Tax=Drosophila guanche TaxID=7266 RepID=UPI0014709B03|nr:uncharacterized protein LOC117580661 [Drosophila guanche]